MVWEYRIGDYQVAKKYLTDRKKRVLSLEENRALQKGVEGD